METLKQRLEEQKKRHEGGSKMIGTGGARRPSAQWGYNPEGRAHRPGQEPPWQGREGSGTSANTRNLDDSVELGHAQHQGGAFAACANGARQGAEVELDLPGTIKDTANKGLSRPEG